VPKSSTGIDRLYTHTHERETDLMYHLLLLNGRCCVRLYTADIVWANIIGTPLRALLGYYVEKSAEKKLKNKRKCCLYSSKETSAFLSIVQRQCEMCKHWTSLGLEYNFVNAIPTSLCLYNIQHCDKCTHAWKPKLLAICGAFHRFTALCQQSCRLIDTVA
jgi:hypothetical protein